MNQIVAFHEYKYLITDVMSYYMQYLDYFIISLIYGLLELLVPLKKTLFTGNDKDATSQKLIVLDPCLVYKKYSVSENFWTNLISNYKHNI